MAKEDFANIVGAEHVVDDEKTLQAYAGDGRFASPGLPWSVVRPKNIEEVQGIVKLANETNMPIIPVSSPGGPRFHGGTIASQGGVMLDLSGMNRILNIDRKDRMAVIEPGVTFDQFDGELRKHGLRAFKPLMPRGTKSVLASYLEREPVVVPRDHWDSLDPLVTVEVVFGTGDLFRTGSAAGPPAGLKEQLDVGLRQCFPGGPGSTSLSRVVQGAQGGYRLATAPRDVTLLDVVEAVMGSLALNDCVARPGSCSRNPDCPIHPIWKKATEQLCDTLRAATLEELISGNGNGGKQKV